MTKKGNSPIIFRIFIFYKIIILLFIEKSSIVKREYSKMSNNKYFANGLTSSTKLDFF